MFCGFFFRAAVVRASCERVSCACSSSARMWNVELGMDVMFGFEPLFAGVHVRLTGG